MNETQDVPPPGDADDGFDPQRLQSIPEIQRTRDDRVVAGVCAGVGRHIGVDPVVVRIIVAVLTLVGLSGLILYLAGWLLLPAEESGRSIAADWFNLEANEPQVRRGGLLVAVVLAVLAVVGDSGWGWGWDGGPAFWIFFWVGIPLLALYWLFSVRPRRRREADRRVAATRAPSTVGPGDTVVAPPPDPRPGVPPRTFSWALTVLTVSLTTIAVAVLWLVARDELGWTALVAAALGGTVLGLLVGTVVGDAGPLVLVGLLLTAVLAVGALVPSPDIGDQLNRPMRAAEVESTYELGMGRLTLDLTDVRDPEELLGRTVEVRHGLGQTRVLVPDDLPVRVEATVRAGDVAVFDRRANGTGATVREDTGDEGPALTLDIEQSMGAIEVESR